MKKPHIYEDELYIFDLLIIDSIKFVTEDNDSYIELNCVTPKYGKIFRDAYFHMKSDTLFAIVETIEDGNLKNIKRKLKYLLNKKMPLPDSEPVEIDIVELRKKLGGLPVIDKCFISAYVKDYEIEEYGKIIYIIFEIGVSQDNIIPDNGQVNHDYVRKIMDIAADIRVLAMQEGYDLTAGWDHLNAMFVLKTIHDYYGKDSGSYIIKVFLGFLKNWRSDKIKPLRQELKDLVK